MRKIFFVLSMGVFLIIFSSVAYADLVVNGGFEDQTGIASNAVVWDSNYVPDGAEKFINGQYDVGADEGQWFDWRQWVRVDGADNFTTDAPAGYSGNNFAYHAIQFSGDGSTNPYVINGNNDLLFQGVYFSSGLSAGTQVTFSFDYILNKNSGDWASATAYVLGFIDGGYLQNNAPFNASYDGSAGVALNSYTHTPLKESLGQTASNTWNQMSYSFILPEYYDALVVAFNFGGADNEFDDRCGTIFAGIDNVSLSAPEPTTLLLLVFGLLGLVGLRRR